MKNHVVRKVLLTFILGYFFITATYVFVLVYQGGICQGKYLNNVLRLVGRDKINLKIME